jgi:hypothetical protein
MPMVLEHKISRLRLRAELFKFDTIRQNEQDIWNIITIGMGIVAGNELRMEEN